MDEAELRIEEVVVEHALSAGLRDESRPTVARHEYERIAGFQGAEDANESGFDALFADQLFGPMVLLERTVAIEIGVASLGGDGASVFDEAVAVLRSNDFDEVAASHLEDVIDETLQFPRGRHGQMPLEDHPVKTMQGADDEAGKLGQKPPY